MRAVFIVATMCRDSVFIVTTMCKDSVFIVATICKDFIRVSSKRVYPSYSQVNARDELILMSWAKAKRLKQLGVLYSKKN